MIQRDARGWISRDETPRSLRNTCVKYNFTDYLYNNYPFISSRAIPRSRRDFRYRRIHTLFHLNSEIYRHLVS